MSSRAIRTLLAIGATRADSPSCDPDRRQSRTLRRSAMRIRSRQECSDMSLYLMFAGKIVLFALAFARLG